MKNRFQSLQVLRGSLALAACLGAATSARASTQFPAGSLIIPTNAAYQDPCGMVSTYGLIFQVLRANASLQALGREKITVHWSYSASKGSPNRCVPTNLDTPPTTGGATPAWNDARWNDGCDFRVVSNSSQPVTLIDNVNSVNDSSKDLTVQTINNTSGYGPKLVNPTYGSHSITYNVLTPLTNVSSVGYAGGAFIISAADAPTFLDLLTGRLVATDGASHNVTFSQYQSNPYACNLDSNGAFYWDTSHGMVNDGSSPYANVHKVNVHRALVPFTADDNNPINATPSTIALLYTAGGVVGVTSSGNGVKSDMLPKYLKSAGLNFTGAQGCPPGGYNANNTGLCPNGGTKGQIYDILDVHDLETNVISTAGYKVAWVPHWEGFTFSGCGSTCISNAITNLTAFSNQPNALLAECASIGVLEGATGSWTYNANTSLNSALLTCSKNAVTGNCNTPVASVTNGITHQGSDIVGNYQSVSGALPNCTDPNLATGSACIYHASPADPLEQIGDYTWLSQSGVVEDYKPNGTGVTYRTGVQPLAFTIPSVNTASLGSYAQARAQYSVDNFTYIQKDGTKQHAKIVYLGGHTYSSNVAGTRVVLNTILNLGFFPGAHETGFIGVTPYNATAILPTYDRVNPGLTAAEQTYAASSASQWTFPLHRGHLRSLNVAGLSGGTGGSDNAFVSNVYNNYTEAGASLANTSPGARNLFTYLGGSVNTGTSLANGVQQTGWVPTDLDAPALGVGCVDNFTIGELCGTQATCSTGNTVNKTNYSGPSYAGMAPGADTVCDLQEALGLTIKAADLGSDHGVAEKTTIVAKLKTTAAVMDAKAVLQTVRGYCYGTDTKVDGTGNLVIGPTTSQCNAPSGGQVSTQDNHPHLGALVKSKAVVVGPSPFITDAPAGKHRPTVAYVGGLDGMLHAFYVPSIDGSDQTDVSGYTGPASAVTALNHGANEGTYSVFHTKYATGFTPPTGTLQTLPDRLIELWAFVPPGQLPYLATNNAKVDSTPSVIDVFGDFTNSGSRSWHTVLVASAGDSNRELFAVDVTNPLNPIMLWDLESSYDSTQLAYAPSSLTDDDSGLQPAASLNGASSFVWSNSCLNGDSTCTAATYVLPPATDPGLAISGPYNFADLGASTAIDLALLRRNNAPVYTAFVPTNQPAGNGLNVFAIDVVTGQKIWEFKNPYNLTAGVGNTTPAGVALASTNRSGLIDALYVGDDEGKVWEIDPADGVNKTSFTSQGCTAPCNFPLSNALGTAGSNGPQPISTIPFPFLVPDNLASTSALYSLRGELMLAYGTAGTDTVAALGSATGEVHLVSLDPDQRMQASAFTSGTSIAAHRTQANTYGVSSDPTPYPAVLPAGERLYGGISLAGDQLVFGSTRGSVTDIDQRNTLVGSTYRLNLGSDGTSPLTGVKSSGSVASTPVVYYVFSNGAISSSPVPPAGTTLASTRVVTITNSVVQVIDINNTSSTNQAILDSIAGNRAISGNKGGTNGTVGFFGWFFRSLGREY